MIKLQSIARQISAEPVMEELFDGEISVAEGLLGDLSPVSAGGEISVLSKDSWVKVCHEAECEVPWLAHGANLLIKGFEFLPTDLGRTLRIGEVELEIAREHAPSTELENQAPALYAALLLGWRGGVVCRVLRSGTIQTGDTVDIVG
jgi:MOSC domain-containing protein YiiM